jgi:hypothetical protein
MKHKERHSLRDETVMRDIEEDLTPISKRNVVRSKKINKPKRTETETEL